MAELVDHPYLQAAFRMKTRLLLLVGLALCALSVLGQSTSEPLPVELTLSTGRYPEAIASDTLHRIGQFGYSTVTGKAYRFAVQGQDEDDEIYGARGTHYCFEHRMHDPRVGRFLSLDPLAAKYAYNSPYAFSENRVLDGIEFEGLEVVLNKDRRVDGVTVAMNVAKQNDPENNPTPQDLTQQFDHRVNAVGQITNPQTPPTPNPSPTQRQLTPSLRQARLVISALDRPSAAGLQQATTGNTASEGYDPTFNRSLPNQFNGAAIYSTAAGGVMPGGALAGNIGGGINNPNNPANFVAGAPLTHMAGNVSRVTIYTNGTPAAFAQAQVAAGALPGRIQIQIVTAPGVIAAQAAAGRGNANSFIVVYNETQSNRAAGWAAAGGGVGVLWSSPNWGAMILTPPALPLRDTDGFRVDFVTPTGPANVSP
jgi:hypothetical protein